MSCREDNTVYWNSVWNGRCCPDRDGRHRHWGSEWSPECGWGNTGNQPGCGCGNVGAGQEGCGSGNVGPDQGSCGSGNRPGGSCSESITEAACKCRRRRRCCCRCCCGCRG